MYLYVQDSCPRCKGTGEVLVDYNVGSYERCNCVREVDAGSATSMLLSKITAPESNEALLQLISEYGNQMYHAGMNIGSTAGISPEARAKAKFELISTYIKLCMQVKEII